ncbi:MAG: HNH endonuclease [Stellaceae bacterium]
MSHNTTPHDICAYCGEPACTVDHVPPRCLFTPPLPSNLITIPACKNCNNGASDDDEVFRNELSIMAGSFRESANAAERLQPSLRSMRRNKATRKRVVGARPVERYSAGGIYLGYGYAVPMTPDAHNRVLTRIVRGLYWHHFEARLGKDACIELVLIDKTKPNWEGALSVLKRLQPKHVQVGDGQPFRYFYGRAVDDASFSFWLLVFFEGAGEKIILAHTHADSAPPAIS